MCLFRVGVYYILTSLKSIIQRKPKWLPFNQILERDLSRVFFTKTFAVIYEFIFFNFLIKDQRKKMNYKIALLAYLFDCVVVFFDLFSGKDHPLLCWIVPPPKDLC